MTDWRSLKSIKRNVLVIWKTTWYRSASIVAQWKIKHDNDNAEHNISCTLYLVVV